MIPLTFMAVQDFQFFSLVLKCLFNVKSQCITSQLAHLSSTSLSMRKVWGSIPWLVKSDTVTPTAHHHCDISS